jgi:hypothetical protein
MKTFTRIVLPILLVAGVVFGITFIQMYSPDEDKPDATAGGSGKPGGPQGLPLKFGLTRVAAPKEERTESGPAALADHLRHLKYWNGDVEVGAPGHYDFWCQNRAEQPVTARVTDVNCQCAGVAMAVVPPDAYRDYAVGSALAGGPLCPAPGPAALVAHLALRQRLTWEALYQDGQPFDRTVPAAGPGRPQFALVRLSWSGKAIGPKNIFANLYAGLPGAPAPSHQRLDAEINVVPAFELVRRTGPTGWAPTRELPVGDLREDAVVTQEFFLLSSTRSYPVYSVSGDAPDPCVRWDDPVPATPEEVHSVTDFISRLDDREAAVRPPKSLFKVRVTVRERVGDRQLDLGPIERRLLVTAAGGGALALTVRGRVFGEVTILSGAEAGKVDLGSFGANEDRTRAVDLVADRPGLELTLAEAETTPNYLKARLEKLPPTGDGRNKYRLRVTVPKGSVPGSLPETSAVILKTNGPTPRRFRLPVRGMTYDSGGPRL